MTVDDPNVDTVSERINEAMRFLDQFQYIKNLTWFPGLGEQQKKLNKTFTPEPRCVSFCFLPLSLESKYEF